MESICYICACKFEIGEFGTLKDIIIDSFTPNNCVVAADV